MACAGVGLWGGSLELPGCRHQPWKAALALSQLQESLLAVENEKK